MSMDAELHWPTLRSLAEGGQTENLLEEIQKERDDATRISLYRSTIRHLAFDEWRNKDLDVMTAVADAAIADCDVLGGDYLEQANLICFNTSANLADCWADDFPRQARHFEKGIAYANKALWYREHLSKGPGAKAMATWALGKHQQSLGRLNEATESFRRCLALETVAADEADKPAEVSSDAPSGYLIAAGYLALMTDDREVLDRLAAVLASMKAEGGELKTDADIIEGQLMETAKRLRVRWDGDLGSAL